MIPFVIILLSLLSQTQPVLVPIDSNNWHIEYPTNINSYDYTWLVQFSTNLQTMTFEYLTQQQQDTNGVIQIARQYPIEYFRLVGIPNN